MGVNRAPTSAMGTEQRQHPHPQSLPTRGREDTNAAASSSTRPRCCMPETFPWRMANGPAWRTSRICHGKPTHGARLLQYSDCGTPPCVRRCSCPALVPLNAFSRRLAGALAWGFLPSARAAGVRHSKSQIVGSASRTTPHPSNATVSAAGQASSPDTLCAPGIP